MRQSTFLFLLLILFSIISCDRQNDGVQMEKYKTEVRNTERDFAALAKEKGLKIAFVTYASEHAVLERGGKLIKGKKAIADYYDKQNLENVSLQWEPEFIEVSSSGDLAYTYGPYEFSSIDENGEKKVSKGIFHTVWKKQPDGKWRFVWD